MKKIEVLPVFFWLSDPNDPTSKFDVCRFKAVLFGATSSPFILNATLDKHLSRYNELVAEDIKKNIYFDDMILSLEPNTKMKPSRTTTEQGR